MCEEAEMDRFQASAQGKHGVFSSGLVIGMLLAFFFTGPVGCYETRAEKERAIAQGKCCSKCIAAGVTTENDQVW
jgi:hypothetical protein